MTMHPGLTEEHETLMRLLGGVGGGGARAAALATPDLLINLSMAHVALKPLWNLGHMLAYAHRVAHTGRTRRTPMDVDALVELWTTVLVDLATAHDHAARSAADERSDELLGPLLTAPIKQLREFAQKLAARLKEDERVPFLVWSTFERLIAPLILLGPEGKTVQLKTQLATEIAELVEKDLDRADLIAAMAAALQWRSPSALEKVKTELEKGARPRLKGGESCLFLHVGEGADEVSVVL